MPASLRQAARARAQRRCEYCGFREDHLPLWPFHLDHIVARQHRGAEDLANLAWACHRCNLFKGTNLSGVDPDTDEITLLFNPRKQRWKDHFVLKSGRIFGRTPPGRATVWLLQMNTEERIALRLVLREDGQW